MTETKTVEKDIMTCPKCGGESFKSIIVGHEKDAIICGVTCLIKSCGHYRQECVIIENNTKEADAAIEDMERDMLGDDYDILGGTDIGAK